MSETVKRTAQDAYEQVYEYVKRNTVAHPEQRAVRESSLKTSLCANGSLKVAQVDTALRALGEQEKIQYGSNWIVPVVDQQYHRDAIGWVASRDDPPKALIGKMNKAIQDHDW